MDWGNVAATISKSAPILGSLLPGVGTVVGAGVGAAASIVASALGTSADPDSVYAALKSDPEALAKVRQAELDNQSKLQELAVSAEKNRMDAAAAQYAAEAADRDSARQLAAKQTNDKLRPALTVLLILGGIGILVAVLAGFATKTISDPAAGALVGVLVRDLFGWVRDALGFWFGTAKDSTDVVEAAQKVLERPAATVAVVPTVTAAPVIATAVATEAPAGDLYRGS